MSDPVADPFDPCDACGHTRRCHDSAGCGKWFEAKLSEVSDQLKLAKTISSKYCDERDTARKELSSLKEIADSYLEAHAALDEVGAPPKENPDGVSVARSVAERIRLMAEDASDVRKVTERCTEMRKMREEHCATVEALVKERDDARADHIAAVEDMREAIRKKDRAEAAARVARRERDEAREATRLAEAALAEARNRIGTVVRLPADATHLTPAEAAEKVRALLETAGTVVVGRHES